MAYWHIQLHSDNPNWDREEELLEKKALIGIGDYWPAGERQIEQFKNDMKIEDIVLVRKGETPIALVVVIGEVEDIGKNDWDKLDWFRYRRKVKVLDWAKNREPFPQLRGTLQRLVNKKTKSYQYIHNWYIQKIQKQYKNKDLINGSYKLKKFYIENFKMLHQFKINFIDNNENPLPLIVIAGKNGTGKTTLLEYLANCEINKEDYIEILKVREEKVDIFKIIDGMKGIKAKRDEYKKHIIYLPVEINKIDNIEEAIINYYINIGEAKDLRPSETIKELQDFINRIFTKDFNLSFIISRVDIITRQVFFRNSKNIEFSINELSTGEKTLLSKVFYLYFKDIKNQIILIDEPELSLHPAWQNRVLKLYENFAKENNCQIIIATHSPHIIGSAKNEYIRVLTEDGVINDVLAYGRDIEWVLKEVMGSKLTREPIISKKIEECQELLDDEKYDEAEKLIDALEKIIGENDSKVMSLRNSLEFWRE